MPELGWVNGEWGLWERAVSIPKGFNEFEDYVDTLGQSRILTVIYSHWPREATLSAPEGLGLKLVELRLD